MVKTPKAVMSPSVLEPGWILYVETDCHPAVPGARAHLYGQPIRKVCAYSVNRYADSYCDRQVYLAGRFVAYTLGRSCIYFEVEDHVTHHRVPVHHYLTKDADALMERYRDIGCVDPQPRTCECIVKSLSAGSSKRFR